VGTSTHGYKDQKMFLHHNKTCLTHLHLLHNKSDTFRFYKDFEAWCDMHFDAWIKILHSDHGGEYLGKEFVIYLKSKGTEQKLTVYDTPQHNGINEHRNRMNLCLVAC
jgi:hypothetical protein